MPDKMSIGVMAHLNGKEIVSVGLINVGSAGTISVRVGNDLTLFFNDPDTLVEFLAAITKSPEVRDFLKNGGY